MKNVIYKITNLTNNKCYIGLTTQGIEQRYKEHLSRLSKGDRDHKLYQAFKKYGIDNFKYEPIFYCFNKQDLPVMEIKFINQFNSYNNGYNMTIGGDFVSDETKLKLSKIFKGRKITWYNKILESRKKNLNDKRQKHFSVLNSNGMVLDVWNLKQFCREKHIDYSTLFNQSKKDKFSRGYLIIESSTTSPLDVRVK